MGKKKKKRNQNKVKAGRERTRQSRAFTDPGRIFRDGVLLSKSQTTKRLKQEAADKAAKARGPVWRSPGSRAESEEVLGEEPIAETTEKTETIAERLERIRTST